MKSISYCAPLPLTLAGSSGAPFNGSVLILAIDPGVCVEIHAPSEKKCESRYENLVKTVESFVFGKTKAPNYSVKVTYGYPHDNRSVQAACITALVGALLEFKKGTQPAQSEIQLIAYQAEKKLFKQFSFAQTVAATGGGLLFYRKEFSFFRTVMKLPMKLPADFLNGVDIVEGSSTENEKKSYDKIIRQLVFAVQTESGERWGKGLQGDRGILVGDLTLSFGTSRLSENHTGVTAL